MPKAEKKHNSLWLQLQEKPITAKPSKQKKEKEIQEFVDPKTSKKILKMIREQQLEVALESRLESGADGGSIHIGPLAGADSAVSTSTRDTLGANNNNLNNGIQRQDSDSGNDSSDQEYQEWDQGDDLDIDTNDQELVQKFMNSTRSKVNISELILSKLETSEIFNQQNQAEQQQPSVNPKVVEVYSKVGLLLSRYKSGPLPKTFKIIPNLRDWEKVLSITNPDSWTPQATYEATRIFTSNLKSRQAQRFFNLILLEKVRDDISSSKKLNYHLYMALKKSLYKPGAFFKGILLPLLESGNCTLREAAIIGSVLVKNSVPVLHSAAALLKIAEMDYTGSNSLFIRLLLDKKYALPFKVIDSLVFHFNSFRSDSREMPVLWQQSLLVFCQRYKNDLTVEQKECLRELSKIKVHYQISPEIRYELDHSECRGASVEDVVMQ